MVRIVIEKVSRLPRWPTAIIICGIAYLAMVSAIELLVSHDIGRPVLCPFKRLTGLPCLTCGATRSAISFLSGDMAQAFFYNPMIFTAFWIFVAALALRLMVSRRLRIFLTSRQRRVALVLAILCVLANWVYVIRAGL